MSGFVSLSQMCETSNGKVCIKVVNMGHHINIQSAIGAKTMALKFQPLKGFSLSSVKPHRQMENGSQGAP